MQISTQILGRSLGLKLLMVCGLVVLMAIPALFISIISYERSNRAEEVTREVGERYGGEQTLLGPVLVVPYHVLDDEGVLKSRGEYVVFADDGQIDIPSLRTQIRKRSLYKVPTYEANADISANFILPQTIGIDTKGDNGIVWGKAKILVGVSDVRGLRDDVFLTLPDGEKRKFTPALRSEDIRISVEAIKDGPVYHKGLQALTNLQYMQVDAQDLLVAGGELKLELNVSLAGASSLTFIPFAKSTKVSVTSDWPHPGFNGRFAPTERTISQDGFSAQWSVPFLARGVAGAGAAHSLGLYKMIEQSMNVKLVSPVNPYQNVNRALKYAVLFIGIVFLAYFLFEVMVGVRVHAAQYVLIGLTQCIFYLLLLAFSEHIGFTLAFIIAAIATIGASAGYAGAVFGERKYSARAGLVFSAVYGLLYVLMRLEDFALMVGALTAFLAIAGTMYLTRHVNWYGDSKQAV
ncbi:MAG: cell envelope integrity protein CreD [Robiginitomaculum sp.]|nr:cell envelope integrity protein CreD [Robiginitomaculum sp.]